MFVVCPVDDVLSGLLIPFCKQFLWGLMDNIIAYICFLEGLRRMMPDIQLVVSVCQVTKLLHVQIILRLQLMHGSSITLRCF